MTLTSLTTAVLLIFIAGINANPVLIQNDDVTSNCPPGYSQPAFSSWNKCYKVYTTYKSRKDAVAQCKRDNGTLAAVPDGFTNANIYSQATKVGASSLWLGVQCFNGDQQSCINDDNTNFVYNNFAPGQPTSQDICVYMSTIGRDSQSWSTFDCEQPFQFACEVAVGSGSGPKTRPPTTTTRQPTTSTQKVGTCLPGWTAFQGKCYTKYDIPSSSRDMQSAQCKKTPDGNLASIPNKDVDNFLNTIPCTNPHLRIGLSCPNTTVPGNTDTCVWDDGTPFSYNRFASGEPSATAAKNCVYEFQGAWYNAFPCEQSFECSACEAPMQ